MNARPFRYILMWLVLTVASVAVVGFSLNWMTYHDLVERGIPTQGRVTAKEPENHRFITLRAPCSKAMKATQCGKKGCGQSSLGLQGMKGRHSALPFEHVLGGGLCPNAALEDSLDGGTENRATLESAGVQKLRVQRVKVNAIIVNSLSRDPTCRGNIFQQFELWSELRRVEIP